LLAFTVTAGAQKGTFTVGDGFVLLFSDTTAVAVQPLLTLAGAKESFVFVQHYLTADRARPSRSRALLLLWGHSCFLPTEETRRGAQRNTKSSSLFWRETSELEVGIDICAVFFDYRKAFDSVSLGNNCMSNNVLA